MIYDQKEKNILIQKKLYNDAFYLHLIHNGYTPEQAQRKVMIIINTKMNSGKVI